MPYSSVSTVAVFDNTRRTWVVVSPVSGLVAGSRTETHLPGVLVRRPPGTANRQRGRTDRRRGDSARRRLRRA